MLTEQGFFKSQFNFRRVPTAQFESAPIYGYESHGKIYDVMVLGGSKYYRVNTGHWYNTIDHITPVHVEVERHFSI